MKLTSAIPFAVLPLLFGCAEMPPVKDLPQLEADPADEGPVVHIHNDTPRMPLALYRLEGETAGTIEEVYTRTDIGHGGHAERQLVGQEGTMERRLICLAPCDRVVVGGPNQLFFLAGEGIVPSTRFLLPPTAQRFDLRASAGSDVRRALGGPFVGLGIAFLVLGAVLTPVAVSYKTPTITGVTVGTALLGGVLLGAGIPLQLGGRTTVSFQ